MTKRTKLIGGLLYDIFGQHTNYSLVVFVGVVAIFRIIKLTLLVVTTLIRTGGLWAGKVTTDSQSVSANHSSRLHQQ